LAGCRERRLTVANARARPIVNEAEGEARTWIEPVSKRQAGGRIGGQSACARDVSVDASDGGLSQMEHVLSMPVQM
jgi:hypothetical protein